jgi:hypothetical protein
MAARDYFYLETLAAEVKRIFNAHGEAWEAEAIKNHTEMGQVPFVEKYVGLRFYDHDASENYEMLGEKCQWRTRRGWYVRVRALQTRTMAKTRKPMPSISISGTGLSRQLT